MAYEDAEQMKELARNRELSVGGALATAAVGTGAAVGAAYVYGKIKDLDLLNDEGKAIKSFASRVAAAAKHRPIAFLAGSAVITGAAIKAAQWMSRPGAQELDTAAAQRK